MIIDLFQKDWANHLIVAGGILVAILILMGFFNVIPFFTGRPAPKVEPITCAECITIDDNNTQFAIGIPGEIKIELPYAVYSPEDMVIAESATGQIVRVGEPIKASDQYWLILLKTVAKGTLDVSVKAQAASTTDFHVSFIVQ